MRKLFVLRAILKSTFLKKILKSMIFNVKSHLKSMKKNDSFFAMSDFELKFLQRVRF